MAGLDYFGAEMFQPSEEQQRNRTECAGCHRAKDLGLIVCWDCFKRGEYPFKYWQGTWEGWLKVRTR